MNILIYSKFINVQEFNSIVQFRIENDFMSTIIEKSKFKKLFTGIDNSKIKVLTYGEFKKIKKSKIKIFGDKYYLGITKDNKLICYWQSRLSYARENNKLNMRIAWLFPQLNLNLLEFLCNSRNENYTNRAIAEWIYPICNTDESEMDIEFLTEMIKHWREYEHIKGSENK